MKMSSLKQYIPIRDNSNITINFTISTVSIFTATFCCFFDEFYAIFTAFLVSVMF